MVLLTSTPYAVLIIAVILFPLCRFEGGGEITTHIGLWMQSRFPGLSSLDPFSVNVKYMLLGLGCFNVSSRRTKTKVAPISVRVRFTLRSHSQLCKLSLLQYSIVVCGGKFRMIFYSTHPTGQVTGRLLHRRIDNQSRHGTIDRRRETIGERQSEREVLAVRQSCPVSGSGSIA